MRFRVRYNQAIPEDAGDPLSLGTIVDDVLGLPGLPALEGGQGPYRLWLLARYRPHEREAIAKYASDMKGETALGDRLWKAAGDLLVGDFAQDKPAEILQIRIDFYEAGADASKGRLSPKLAPHLARVRHLGAREVEANDLPALAAWALEEKLRAGPVKIAICDLCGLTWLPDRQGTYCRRLAPGVFGMSCREVVAQQTYRERHIDFQRERKKLYERVGRGTLPGIIYQGWLVMNRPGPLGETWVSFEDWTAGKRPKGGTTSGK